VPTYVSAVDIATGYGLDDRGSIAGRGNRFFSSPDGCKAYPASYPMGFRGFFFRVKTARGIMLTTHLRVVPRSIMVELYLHSPTHLYGVALS
jgi:hypothetical protein